MRNPLTLALIGLVRLYRLVPKRADTCRFHPTCSAYGLEALQVHGSARGTWLILRRLAKCHPWGGSGIDRVPRITEPSVPQRDLVSAAETSHSQPEH